jgi:cell division septal protein FtsQ
MARKRQKILLFPLFKIGVVVLLASLLGFVCYRGVSYAFSESDFFKVKVIKVDPSLVVVNRDALEKIKGENIFAVDLVHVHEKLAKRYPQIEGLKVTRQFPDQISVEATPRLPVAQFKVGRKVMTIDDQGVVLSTTTPRDEKFPFVDGIMLKNQHVALGKPLKRQEVDIALDLIAAFEANRVLESYTIESIHVENTSKVEFLVSNGLRIFVDQDELPRRMRLLGFILTRADINLEEINYLDLRFKEPVIGKK